jgi:ATP-binding protein involved in chromosome partitioning
MGFLQCPDCGKRIEIFGQGGGLLLADQYDLPLLELIPLDPRVCQGAVEGQPAEDVEGLVTTTFQLLA